MKRKIPKSLYVGLVMGALFGLAQTIGLFVSISDNGHLFQSVGSVGLFFWNFFKVGMGSALVFTLLSMIIERGTFIKNEKSRPLWKNWLIILPLYLICYLAYYPGSVSYDAIYITWQAYRMIGFDSHHPFLHTLIWTILIAIEEKTEWQYFAVVTFSLAQILFVTGVYAYVLTWMEKRAIRKWQKFLCQAYYVLNPVFHIFALSIVKDALFASVFLLYQIFVIDFYEAWTEGRECKKQIIRMSVAAFFSCLLRNNMIYVVLLETLILFIRYRRKILSVMKYMIMSIFCFYVVTEIVFPSMGVAKGSMKEMFSVPMSQIAAVYRYEPELVTAEDEKLIRKYIPSVESYDCYYADYIKHDFNGEEVINNPGEFFSLWMKLLQKAEGVYVRAFLALNLPYWYTGMESVREYIETDNYSQDYLIERSNFLPGIFDFYERIADKQAGFMKLPVFKQMFSIAVPIWIWMFIAVHLFTRGNGEKVLTMLPGLLLWMTYLLGPVSNFRYIVPLMMTWPVYLFLGTSQIAERGNQNAGT